MSDRKYLGLGIIILLLFNFAHARTPNTLCHPNEDVIFSCPIKDRTILKMLSICASKNLSAKHGYLQYRFGQIDKIELKFPQYPTPQSRQLFNYNAVSNMTKGYFGKLTFNKANYVYIVSLVKMRDDVQYKGNTAGVRVRYPDGKGRELICDTFPTGKGLKVLENIVSQTN